LGNQFRLGPTAQAENKMWLMVKVRDIKSIVLRNTLANFVKNCENHVFLRGTSDDQISTFLMIKKAPNFTSGSN